MSDGIRSGVNWMRLYCKPRVSAMVFTSSVLARPGTPTSRQCPPLKTDSNADFTTSSWPIMTFFTSVIIRSKFCFKASTAFASFSYVIVIQS